MAHSLNHIIWEIEAWGLLWIWGQPELQSKTLCQKTKTKEGNGGLSRSFCIHSINIKWPLKLSFGSSFYKKSFFNIFLCVWAFMPWHKCVGQKTISRSQFSSTVWVPGEKFSGHQAWWQASSPTQPFHWPSSSVWK